MRSDGFISQLVRALARNGEPFVAIPHQPGAFWLQRPACAWQRFRAARAGRPLVAAWAGTLRLVATALAVMLMCFLTYAVGLTVGTSREQTGGQPPATVDDVRIEAEAIDALLRESGDIRTRLNKAIADVQACSNLAGAIADLRDLTDQRQRQLDLLAGIYIADLPDAETIRASLTAAFSHARDADAAFTAWAAAADPDGCASPPERSAQFEQGMEASERSGSAKMEFLELWNPVAVRFGLPARERQEI
ncbi:hypothetical protein [Actinoplanes rectilineatus]|uniref:hypothetical protein n=1 Tax=Actinoplanes rectilineatus TaxID=113571 RepID=UPI0005F2B70D|nr:hypothetical protein [Actinoplanes rectilineatus]